jgi:heme exporter protein C
MSERLSSGLFSALVIASMVLALYMVFIYVPTEAQMGVVQRIFYFHVPSAITSFLAFFIVFVASIQYLRTQQEKWDQLALCAAELGVAFSLIVLITGPIWAKPIWGTWWRWEPRLTSMLIMFTMYTAYLMVRAYGTQPLQTRRFAAVLGIIGFVNVPLVHYSIKLWTPEQQLHPQQISLDPRMAYTKYASYLAIFSFFFYLLRWRYQVEKGTRLLAQLRRQTEALLPDERR